MPQDSHVLSHAVRPDVYANNRLSVAMADAPVADLLLLMTGMVHEASFSLPETVIDPQFGLSIEPSESAFMYHHKDKGISGTLFDYLKANVSLFIGTPPSNY